MKKQKAKKKAETKKEMGKAIDPAEFIEVLQKKKKKVVTELGNFIRSKLILLPKQSRGISVMGEFSANVKVRSESIPLNVP